MSSPLLAEVIAIGDELTTGQRLDTNTRWLAERLTEAGVEVRFHTTVGDNLDANVEVFRTAANRAGVVVCSGGLGPTADDLTRDALAAAAGVELLEDAASLRRIEARFRATGRDMPPRNRRQAEFPAGATPIENPGGTAPGIDMTIGDCRLFALPGVPAELKPMWEASVAPAVRELTGGARVTRHLLARCFGAGESRIEEMLGDLIARGREPLVGITASKATITLRITASGENAEACNRAMRPTVERIREALGSLIFAWEPVCGRDHEEIGLQNYAVELLDRLDLRVSALEGMTRGLLGRWLADAESEPARVDLCRVASPASRSDVAAEAREIAGAGCGVAIGEVAEGRVPIAVVTPRGVVTSEITLIGHPSIHQDLVAKHALNTLRLELERMNDGETA